MEGTMAYFKAVFANYLPIQENYEKYQQDSRSLDQDTNPGLCECKAVMLITMSHFAAKDGTEI